MRKPRRFGRPALRPGAVAGPADEALSLSPASPAATAVGVLDGTVVARVGPDGTVVAGALVLRPWIGAEDRWHRLDREAGTRQRLAGDAPVVETLLRVPGGDVLWRVYGAKPAGGGEALVAELENGSKVPVALALVVEAGPGAAWQVEGPALWRDASDAGPGTALLLGARPPGIVAEDDDLDALFDRLAARPDEAGTGQAGTDEAGTGVLSRSGAGVDSPRTAAQVRRARFVALVHPVTHGTTASFVLPLAGPPPAAGALGGLPPADAVSRGWRRMLGSAALVDLPDPTWESAVAAVRSQLVLTAGAGESAAHLGGPGHAVPAPGVPGAGVVAAASAPTDGARASARGATVRALDSWGHHTEAGRLLVLLTADLTNSLDPDVSVAFLGALHHHWRLTGDEELPRVAVEDVGYAVALVDRALRRRGGRPDGPRLVAALRAASGLLVAAGEADAAASVAARAAKEAGRGDVVATPRPLEASPEVVDQLLRAASPTWTWPEADLGARVLLGVRSALVVERHDFERVVERHDGERHVVEGHDVALDLLEGWRPAWRGQGLEVHGLPVAGGRLSYALRWHGERPALLWEALDADGADLAVVLRARVVDPAWQGRGARGEVLLQAPPLPAAAEGAQEQAPGGAEFS